MLSKSAGRAKLGIILALLLLLTTPSRLFLQGGGPVSAAPQPNMFWSMAGATSNSIAPPSGLTGPSKCNESGFHPELWFAGQAPLNDPKVWSQEEGEPGHWFTEAIPASGSPFVTLPLRVDGVVEFLPSKGTPSYWLSGPRDSLGEARIWVGKGPLVIWCT